MSKTVVAIGICLGLTLVALRWCYLQRAEIVVDEFQHLHAAYLVAGGQTPYVDFFEHHTPLFYYVAAPLLRASDLGFDTILSVRHLSLGVSLLTILLAAWWARRLRGTAASALVALLMLGNFFLFARGTVLFLDVLACPFLMLSAIALAETRGRWPMAFASGLAMGVAVLFTQKALMAGFAPLLFFLVGMARRDGGGIRHWIVQLGSFAAGGATAALLLPLLLGFGGLADFFQCNVIMNMAWKARYLSVRDIVLLAVTDGPIYLLALTGSVVGCFGLGRRRCKIVPNDVPILYLASLSLGVILLPVVWTEYFVLVVNFAVPVAGLFLFDVASVCLMDNRGRPELTGGWKARGVVALIAAGGLVAILDLAGRRLAESHTLSTDAVAEVLGLWLAVGGVMAVAIRMRSTRWSALAVLFLLVFPVVEQWDYFQQASNEEQRARMEFVMNHTGPKDCVFDGFSGYGVFRPHAYKYWFLHDEVQLMLSDDELGTDVVDAIERSQAPIVVCDTSTDALPAVVHRYIAQQYAPTEFSDIRLRRQGD